MAVIMWEILVKIMEPSPHPLDTDGHCTFYVSLHVILHKDFFSFFIFEIRPAIPDTVQCSPFVGPNENSSSRNTVLGHF